MAKAKVTFREARRMRVGPHPSSVGYVAHFARVHLPLNFDFSPTIRRFENLYALASDSPTRQDVRATLNALSNIGDDKAPSAVLGIDPSTAALLDEAALQNFRSQRPMGPVPSVIFSMEDWSPSYLRKVASLALCNLDKSGGSAGGRPSLRYLDVLFARSLVDYWWRTRKRKPTISRNNGVFCRFAKDAFKMIGRDLKFNALYLILLAGRRSARG